MSDQREWLPAGEIPDRPCEAWLWCETEHLDDYETRDGPYAAGKVMRVKLWLVRSSLAVAEPDLMVFHRSMAPLESMRRHGAKFRIMPIPEPVRPPPPIEFPSIAGTPEGMAMYDLCDWEDEIGGPVPLSRLDPEIEPALEKLIELGRATKEAGGYHTTAAGRAAYEAFPDDVTQAST